MLKVGSELGSANPVFKLIMASLSGFLSLHPCSCTQSSTEEELLFTEHVNSRVTLCLPWFFSRNTCLCVFQSYLKRAVKKSSKFILYVNASRESSNSQNYIRAVFDLLFSLTSFCKVDATAEKKKAVFLSRLHKCSLNVLQTQVQMPLQSVHLEEDYIGNCAFSNNESYLNQIQYVIHTIHDQMSKQGIRSQQWDACQ